MVLKEHGLSSETLSLEQMIIKLQSIKHVGGLDGAPKYLERDECGC